MPSPSPTASTSSATVAPSGCSSFSTLSRSPCCTRYCLPPVRITAYIEPLLGFSGSSTSRAGREIPPPGAEKSAGSSPRRCAVKKTLEDRSDLGRTRNVPGPAFCNGERVDPFFLLEQLPAAAGDVEPPDRIRRAVEVVARDDVHREDVPLAVRRAHSGKQCLARKLEERPHGAPRERYCPHAVQHLPPEQILCIGHEPADGQPDVDRSQRQRRIVAARPPQDPGSETTVGLEVIYQEDRLRRDREAVGGVARPEDVSKVRGSVDFEGGAAGERRAPQMVAVPVVGDGKEIRTLHRPGREPLARCGCRHEPGYTAGGGQGEDAPIHEVREVQLPVHEQQIFGWSD